MLKEPHLGTVTTIAMLLAGVLPRVASAQPIAEPMPLEARAEFQRLEAEFGETRAHVTVLLSSEAGGTREECEGVRAYGQADVRRGLERLRESLIVVAGRVSQGLRDYVTEIFPAAPERDTGRQMQRCFPGMLVVAASSGDLAFDRVVALFREIRSLTSITIATVQVVSTPSGTAFRLRTRNGRIGFDSATDTTLQNVSRALYVLSVTRPGYQPVIQEINLVRATPTSITCELARDEEARDSVCRYE